MRVSARAQAGLSCRDTTPSGPFPGHPVGVPIYLLSLSNTPCRPWDESWGNSECVALTATYLFGLGVIEGSGGMQDSLLGIVEELRDIPQVLG